MHFLSPRSPLLIVVKITSLGQVPLELWSPVDMFWGVLLIIQTRIQCEAHYAHTSECDAIGVIYVHQTGCYIDITHTWLFCCPISASPHYSPSPVNQWTIYVSKRAGQQTCRPDLVILIVGWRIKAMASRAKKNRPSGLCLSRCPTLWTIIRLLQGASYCIVTYKDMCTMCEIFAYVGLLLGVIARRHYLQPLHGGSELGNVILWVYLITAAAAVEEFSWQVQGGAIDQLCCGALEVFFQGSADAQ